MQQLQLAEIKDCKEQDGMGDEATVVRQLQGTPEASTSYLCQVQQELELLFRSQESELAVFIFGI